MITFGDLFAGGGGVTTGALSIPGIHVKWALNHDPVAIATHGKNHPETKHFQADIRLQTVKEVDPVDILWASIECTQHSKAKGGGSKNIGSYTLGWELLRYIKHCDPFYLLIENVSEFVKWSPTDDDGNPIKERQGEEYQRWVDAIKDLGYEYDHKFLNAADYDCPTRRVRYFGVFAKKGLPILWKESTSKDNWLPCKPFIDLEHEGNSIFGRKFNMNIRKHLRKPLSKNTLRRIGGGMKKFAPEMFFIMKYYGTGDNCHSVKDPLHTIRTKESHALIKVEKMQFINDHCHTDSHQELSDPLRPQLTRQTKELITLEKKFLVQHYSGIHASDLDNPIPTITTIDHNALISTKAHFLSPQYNSNGKPEANNQSINEPIKSITTEEKFQFITAYFNSNGRPETQNQSIHNPMNTILTGANKKALVTAVKDGLIDFDIKMRFLTKEELGAIMGFPEGYFEGLSNKKAIRLIGNSVPTGLAAAVIEPNKQALEEYFNTQIQSA